MQNTNTSQFLVLLLLGGLEAPYAAAAAGAVWLAGRLVYTIGYSTGELPIIYSDFIQMPSSFVNRDSGAAAERPRAARAAASDSA